MEDDWREFSNFLNSRGAVLPCPACGADSWQVSKRRYMLVEVPAEDKYDDDTATLADTASMEVLPLTFLLCLQCLHMRLHLAQTLPAREGEDAQEP
jgi:hypothetical protein